MKYNITYNITTYKYFFKIFYNKTNKINIIHKFGSITYIIPI